MPLSLTWSIALILIADGFLIGVGFHFAGVVVNAILGAVRRQP